MEKQLKDKLSLTMEEVIDTSREVREYARNKDIPLSERKAELPMMQKVLEANKNIVNATINLVKLENIE